MNQALITALCTFALLGSSLASAQVEVRVGLPSISFEAPPPLVVVTPGVQVVEDYDQEVFYTGGYYWYRDNDRWYRTRDHHGGWTLCEREAVPPPLLKFEPGRYRHYRRVVHTASVVETRHGEKVKVKTVKVKRGHGHH